MTPAATFLSVDELNALLGPSVEYTCFVRAADGARAYVRGAPAAAPRALRRLGFAARRGFVADRGHGRVFVDECARAAAAASGPPPLVFGPAGSPAPISPSFGAFLAQGPR
jgi:hypothetical protein